MHRITWQDRPQVKVAFARALRQLRHAAGLSELQLSIRCNIDGTLPSLLELAKRAPTITMFLLLAQGLGVSPQELLTLTLAQLQEIRITGDLTIRKEPGGEWPAHRRNGKTLYKTLYVTPRVRMQDRPQIKTAFGRVLRALRKQAGFSQVGLAVQCGFERTYVSLLERAERSPSIPMFYALADGLEVPSVDLLTAMLTELDTLRSKRHSLRTANDSRV